MNFFLNKKTERDVLLGKTERKYIMFVLEDMSSRSRKKKKKRRSEKSRELVDIGPIFNRLHTRLSFDVAGEIKKGWNREMKERERKEQEKEQRQGTKKKNTKVINVSVSK